MGRREGSSWGGGGALRKGRGLREAGWRASSIFSISFPLLQVGNLGLLFMLLFFIFAALGVELFGDLGELRLGMVEESGLESKGEFWD